LNLFILLMNYQLLFLKNGVNKKTDGMTY